MSWMDYIPALIRAGSTLAGGYMAGQGGENASIDYAQSPQQSQLYDQMSPTLTNLFQQQGAGQNANLWNIPQAPSMSGVLTGGQQYNPQGYQVPDVQSMMPTRNWYNNMSPEVMAGIRQPYTDASRQLTESLGGSAGSAQAGASGTLGSAQSDFWSRAGTQMGQQAWGMTQPALQAGWNANLGQNQYMTEQQNQGRMNMYNQGQTERGQNYQNQMNAHNMQMTQNQLPYSAAQSMISGTYASPVVQPDTSFNWGNALMGAGVGGYMGSQYGGQYGGQQQQNPYANNVYGSQSPVGF